MNPQISISLRKYAFNMNFSSFSMTHTVWDHVKLPDLSLYITWCGHYCKVSWSHNKGSIVYIVIRAYNKCETASKSKKLKFKVKIILDDDVDYTSTINSLQLKYMMSYFHLNLKNLRFWCDFALGFKMGGTRIRHVMTPNLFFVRPNQDFIFRGSDGNLGHLG